MLRKCKMWRHCEWVAVEKEGKKSRFYGSYLDVKFSDFGEITFPDKGTYQVMYLVYLESNTHCVTLVYAPELSYKV